MYLAIIGFLMWKWEVEILTIKSYCEWLIETHKASDHAVELLFYFFIMEDYIVHLFYAHSQ